MPASPKTSTSTSETVRLSFKSPLPFYGQLGVDPNDYGEANASPVVVVDLDGVVQLASGRRHACALRAGITQAFRPAQVFGIAP